LISSQRRPRSSCLRVEAMLALRFGVLGIQR
jgi:hypothetical protein